MKEMILFHSNNIRQSMPQSCIVNYIWFVCYGVFSSFCCCFCISLECQTLDDHIYRNKFILFYIYSILFIASLIPAWRFCSILCVSFSISFLLCNVDCFWLNHISIKLAQTVFVYFFLFLVFQSGFRFSIETESCCIVCFLVLFLIFRLFTHMIFCTRRIAISLSTQI